MVSVDGLLDAHEVAVRARVEGLRDQLAAAERDLERVVITRETLRLVVAGQPVVVDVAGAADDVGAGGRVRSGSEAVVVPVWRPGMTEVVLPLVYQQVWKAVRAGEGGCRAKEVCRVLGFPTTPTGVEAMRSRLKRLAGRGWVIEQVPGLFTTVVSGSITGSDAVS